MMPTGNRTFLRCLLSAALMLPLAHAVPAQSVKKPEQAAGKKDLNVSLKALDAGGKAYSSGKLDVAIEQLTAALANGGLPSNKMAQAYYFRGLTYKKQKKPAQALSDLNVAVWVKGGLNDAERATALDARNQVYREAGLGDQAPPVANAVAPSPPTASAAPAAAAAAPPAAAPVPPAPASSAPAPPAVAAAAPPPPAAVAAPAERPVWQAEANSTPPPPMPLPAEATAPPPAKPAEVAALSPSSGGTVDDAYRPPAPAAAPLAAANPEPAQQSAGSDMMAPLASAGSSISGFFSNVFGQGSGAKPAEPAATTTGSTDGNYGWAPVDNTSPQGPVAQVSASEPQRAPGWEAAAATPPAPHHAVAAAAPASVKSGSGKYRLQLASVRSREEADRLAQTVMAQHASQLGGAATEIDEAVIGNMGTFYRVRVGPYADANEPRKLCTTLKPQGYDCQVVTQ